MSNGRINGKQIIDNTVVKTINGLTASDQWILTNSDSNVTLNIATAGSTHSLTVGWNGILPLNRGGLSNSTFTASQILIVNSATNSIISSGYKFNDGGTASSDIWSARHTIDNIVSLTLTGARAANNVTNTYLRSSDGLPYNTTPLLLPFDGTIKYISISTAGASTWIGEVRNNGTAITGASISVNNSTGTYSAFNINVNAGDLLQLYCNGTNVNNPRMVVSIIKR